MHTPQRTASNGPWQERCRVPGTKVPGNKQSREWMVGSV